MQKYTPFDAVLSDFLAPQFVLLAFHFHGIAANDTMLSQKTVSSVTWDVILLLPTLFLSPHRHLFSSIQACFVFVVRFLLYSAARVATVST
jgi:hypothetical protein